MLPVCWLTLVSDWAISQTFVAVRNNSWIRNVDYLFFYFFKLLKIVNKSNFVSASALEMSVFMATPN